MLLISVCLASGFSRAQSFSVSFNCDTITLGESATLTMRFEGGTVRALPALPQIANLGFSGVTGHSTSFNMVNGETTSAESYTFTAVPAQAGTFEIPAITAQVNGQPVTSQPVKLKVLPPGAAAPATETKTAFLKLIVPKTNVYVGEILPVEIQLYYQAAKDPEAPKIKEEGFTLGKINPMQQSSTIVNNQRYNVLPIKTYVVPAKVGDLALGPATMKISIPSPSSRRDFFGSLLDWQAVTLETQPQTLHVQPLPTENVPLGFTGAVGNYRMTLNASPTNVAVGDPITLTVTVTGTGALEGVTLPSVSLPEQKGWEQFKLYPPTSDFEPSQNDPLGLSGSKTFKLTAVPQSMDIKELPVFQFSYFDPDQKRYQTLTQPAAPLIVRPSAASLPPPNLSLTSSDSDSSTGNDIAHIKARPGVLAQIGPPLIARPWFIAMQSVPVLAWLGLLLNRRQKEKLAGNPRLRRQRLVDRIVRESLNELRMAAESNQPEEFYAILFRMLQEQLGERLDLPASAITEAVVDERLRPLQLPEETLTLISQLFQACNQARYAQQVSAAELVAKARDVEYALAELKNITA